MSDLDADLYGDLYGDENEFSVPIEESKESKPQDQPEKTTASATPTPAVIETHEVSKSPPAATMEIKEGSPIPSLANGSAPQPIQSYQSSTQDYSPVYRMQQQRDTTPTTMPSLPIAERHVRPSEMKEEGKMFIGGLNWDTTDEGLKKYFEQFGKVEACTIMRDATGRSRCFAFLTFEDPASVNAVMVREHVLDGKIIDPKRAIPRQEHQRAQKLFIGGLPGTVTSDSMREYFSQYGKVIDSTVMVDRETGRSKGFGFISFENTNVEPLLGFGKLEIDGKMIDVKLAQPRHQREQNDGNFRGGYGGGGGQTDSYGSGGGGYVGSQSPQSNQVGMGGAVAAGGGTPFDPQALAQLYTRMFQQFGGAASMGGMPGMAGMMGAGMGGMGAGMGGMGAGGMAGMGGMGGGAGTGMGRMGGGGAMGMGMGGAPMGPMAARGGMGGGMNAAASAGMMGGAGGPINAPRGPRGASGGPQGIGPQRTQRGHGYHPYSR